MTTRINSLNPKCIRTKGEDKQEIIMIKAIFRIDTDEIGVTGQCHLGVEQVWTELWKKVTIC